MCMTFSYTNIYLCVFLFTGAWYSSRSGICRGPSSFWCISSPYSAVWGLEESMGDTSDQYWGIPTPQPARHRKGFIHNDIMVRLNIKRTPHRILMYAYDKKSSSSFFWCGIKLKLQETVTLERLISQNNICRTRSFLKS